MNATPAPMVSGRYFLPKAPLVCWKWIPDSAVTSVSLTASVDGSAPGAALAAVATAAGEDEDEVVAAATGWPCAESLVGQHHGVVGVDVLGIDRHHLLRPLGAALEVALQEVHASDLVDQDAVLRIVAPGHQELLEGAGVVAFRLARLALEEVSAG